MAGAVADRPAGFLVVTRQPRFLDLDRPQDRHELTSEFLRREGDYILGDLRVAGGRIISTDRGSRWEQDRLGMRFYDTAGAKIFDFDATTGVLTVTGGIVSGGTITGAVITGGTLQTAASGKRVVIATPPGDKVQFFSGDAAETIEGHIQVEIAGAGGGRAWRGVYTSGKLSGQDAASIVLLSETQDGSTGKSAITLSADTILPVATTTSADCTIQLLGDIAFQDAFSDPPTSSAGFVRVWNSGGSGLRTISTGETAPLAPIRVLSAQATADYTITTTRADITGCTKTFTTRVPSAVAHITGAFDFDAVATGYGALVGYCEIDGIVKNEAALFIASAAGERFTVNQTWEHTFAASGSHTIKLQANKSVAGGTAIARNPHTAFTSILIG